MVPRFLRGKAFAILAAIGAIAAVGGLLGVPTLISVISATDITASGLTCTICDNPQFVACNAASASSPRCAGMKGEELRIFCPGATTPYLRITCTSPKIRFGTDSHGLPDKTQNVLTCG